MSSIEPIGYQAVGPTERVIGVSRRAPRDPEQEAEKKEHEDEAADDEQPPPDDRPEPQHVDLRG